MAIDDRVAQWTHRAIPAQWRDARGGELIALRWPHIDLKRHRAEIVEFSTTLGYKVVASSGKSRDATRSIELDDGLVRHFAVNLLDPNESNIEPRQDIKIGGDEVTAAQERRQPHEMWKWIALAALILLVVEWLVYHRRIGA